MDTKQELLNKLRDKLATLNVLTEDGRASWTSVEEVRLEVEAILNHLDEIDRLDKAS